MRVAIYGSGRTSTELVKLLGGSAHEVVAAVVHSPERAGRDFGDLTVGRPLGVLASNNLAAVLDAGGVDVVLYGGLAGPGHEEAMAQCVDAGIDVVHACFVLPRVALPPDVIARLQDRAAATGARVVGTGMIPGLWLEVLPSLLTGALPPPVSVEGERVSDISSWGTDVLTQEIGVGTTASGPSERPELLLTEMALVVADALRLSGAEVQSTGGLVSAQEPTRVGSIDVAAGEVEGFRQSAIVTSEGVERVRLTWSGFGGASTGQDSRQEAVPVRLRLTGGDGSELSLDVTPPLDPYPGTAARMVHAVDTMSLLPPGLHAPTALSIA